ncbi:MAG: hypothetical protein DRP06_04030, partial [Candidatus Aenigmatarchaeota archaeon]
NNRKILIGLLEYAGIENNQNSVILSIDKLEKIKKEGVGKELTEKGLKEEQIKKLFEILEIKGTNEEILSKLGELLTTETGKEGVKELGKLFELIEVYNLEKVVLVPSLARGLNYYTGTIYEVFSKEKTNSSLGAGGRFDELLSKSLRRDLPSVGGSFGLDAISSVIESDKKSNVQIYLIPVGIPDEKFLPVVKKLREKLNVDFDLSGRGISKNLDFANANNISFCAILGEQELKEGKVKLKNMNTREEKVLSVGEVVKIIQG